MPSRATFTAYSHDGELLLVWLVIVVDPERVGLELLAKNEMRALLVGKRRQLAFPCSFKRLDR